MFASTARKFGTGRIFAAFALFTALFTCIAANPAAAWADASCTLTDETREQYAADGTLDARIAYAKENYTVSQEGLIAAALQRESGVATASNVPSDWACGMPTTGKGYILAVAVEFPAEGEVAAMTFDGGLQAQANSIVAAIEGTSGQAAPYDNVRSYYERSSYGKLDLSCRGVCYTVTAKHCRDYYNKNIDILIEEAAQTLHEQGVDFSQYDGNNDGKIDGFYLTFAGENTGWGSDWWPSKSNYTKDPSLTFDGKKLDGFVLTEDINKGGVNTLIHETGHMLGLEDYYSYADQTRGIGTTDMMNLNDGDHNAFSKWLLGWIDDSLITRVAVTEDGIKVRRGLGDVETCTSNLTETIEAFTSDTVSEGGSFIVVSNDEGILTGSLFTSYYLLQYDRPQGNQNFTKDGSSLVSGLRVYRIQAELNESGTNFTHSTCNATSDHDMLIEALLPSDDGSSDVELGNPFHTGATISPSTKPSTNFREDALGYTGIRIDVTNADNQAQGSVAFSYEAKTSPDEFKLTPAFSAGIMNTGAYRFTASVQPDWAKMPMQGATLVVDGASYSVRTVEHDSQLQVSWDLPKGTITANSTCELAFPAGFFDLYGTASNEVRISLTPRASMLNFTESGTYEQASYYQYGERQSLSNVVTVNGQQMMVSSQIDESNCVHLSLLKLSADGKSCESVLVSGFELPKAYVSNVQATALSNGRIFVSLNGTGSKSDEMQLGYWVDCTTNTLLDSRDITKLQFTYLAALGDSVAAIAGSVGLNVPCAVTQIFSSDTSADATTSEGNGIFAQRAQGLSDGSIAGIDGSRSTENGTVKIYSAEEVEKVVAGADGKSMHAKAELDIPNSDAIEDVAASNGSYYVLTRHGSDATPWLELHVYGGDGGLLRTTKIEGTLASRSTTSKLTVGDNGEAALTTSYVTGSAEEKEVAEIAAVAADGTFMGFSSIKNYQRVFWADGRLYVTNESHNSETKQTKVTWMRTAAASGNAPQPAPEPTNGDNGNAGDDAKFAQTGDSTKASVIMAGAIIPAGAICLICAARRRNQN